MATDPLTTTEAVPLPVTTAPPAGVTAMVPWATDSVTDRDGPSGSATEIPPSVSGVSSAVVSGPPGRVFTGGSSTGTTMTPRVLGGPTVAGAELSVAVKVIVRVVMSGLSLVLA